MRRYKFGVGFLLGILCFIHVGDPAGALEPERMFAQAPAPKQVRPAAPAPAPTSAPAQKPQAPPAAGDAQQQPTTLRRPAVGSQNA